MSAPGIVTARIVRATATDRHEIDDAIAIEAPLEIQLIYPSATSGRLVEKPFTVTMRTPGEDRALSTGLLFAEGLIDGHDAIDEWEAITPHTLRVHLNKPPRIDPQARQRTLASTASCGLCGKTEMAALRPVSLPELDPFEPGITVEILRSLPARLAERQADFSSTGGMHAAARFSATGECIDLCEDIGRHNALDKLIGRALASPPQTCSREILLLSGRVSYELIQKALAVGFPLVAAIGAPSSLAIEMAQAARLTLVGFLRRDRHNIYSHPQRIQ